MVKAYMVERDAREAEHRDPGEAGTPSPAAAEASPSGAPGTESADAKVDVLILSCHAHESIAVRGNVLFCNDLNLLCHCAGSR